MTDASKLQSGLGCTRKYASLLGFFTGTLTSTGFLRATVSTAVLRNASMLSKILSGGVSTSLMFLGVGVVSSAMTVLLNCLLVHATNAGQARSGNGWHRPEPRRT